MIKIGDNGFLIGLNRCKNPYSNKNFQCLILGKVPYPLISNF